MFQGSSPLRQVPHSNSLVLAAGNNELMFRVKWPLKIQRNAQYYAYQELLARVLTTWRSLTRQTTDKMRNEAPGEKRRDRENNTDKDRENVNNRLREMEVESQSG